MAALTVGVIGAGTISQSIHLPSIRRVGLNLVYVCDLSPSRAAEVAQQNGVRGTTDPHVIFADPTVDAVIIATPGSHAEIAAAAIRANKHVLIEKPVALTVADIDELESLAIEYRRVAQVGYMKMYDPLAVVAASELSKLKGRRLVRVTVAHPADFPQTSHLRMRPALPDADMIEIARAEAVEIEKSKQALPGATPELLEYYRNVLQGSVVHELSVLRSLGLPLPARWSARVFPQLGGAEPSCLLAEGSVGDVLYILSWNWLPDFPEYDEEVKILAANGRFEYHLGKPYLLEERSHLRIDRHDGLRRIGTEYTDTFETGFLRQLDAFSQAITDTEAGRPVTMMADLAGAREDIVQLQRIAQAIGESLGIDVHTEMKA